jgi:hypothetical protein
MNSTNRGNTQGSNTMSSKAPRLYSPGTVGKLGLLFTPAFAAYFSKQNGEEMGDTEAARSQNRWFLCGVVILVGLVVGFAARIERLENWSMAASFFQVLLWYFIAQRRQVNEVRRRFGRAYAKRPIARATIFASIFLCGFLWWQIQRALANTDEILRRYGLGHLVSDPAEK